MNSHALTMRKSWPRARWLDYRALVTASTAELSDALAGTNTLDHRIHHLAGGVRLIGTAVPVLTACNDNLAPYAALKVLQPGDVMVIHSQTESNCALIGDHISGLMQNGGAAGIVVNGMVRDLSRLQEIGLPIYALGTTPRAPSKRGPGSVGLPISVNSVVIEPGDLIVGDADGIVVVPREKLALVEQALVVSHERDRHLQQRLRAGALEPPDFDQLLETAGIDWQT